MTFSPQAIYKWFREWAIVSYRGWPVDSRHREIVSRWYYVEQDCWKWQLGTLEKAVKGTSPLRLSQVVVLMLLLVTSSSCTWCVCLFVSGREGGREGVAACLCVSAGTLQKGKRVVCSAFALISHQRITWMFRLKIYLNKNKIIPHRCNFSAH